MEDKAKPRNSFKIGNLKQDFYDAGWFLGHLALWFTFALFTSIPGVLIGTTLRIVIQAIASYAINETGLIMIAFETGVRVGLSILAIIGVIVFLPMIWRIVSNPHALRWIAYVAIQIIAVALGLLPESALTGAIFTAVAAGGGSAAWWLWQKRWKGSGVAPSPLVGILKPEIRSGQIWYAVIIGNHDTKIRPVIVLKPAADNAWCVAYLTTQPPKPHLAQYYLDIPTGSLRGLTRENWVSLRDPREILRKTFRSYTGLAPTWLYKELCEKFEIEPDPHAVTVDEDKAGEGVGPIENLIRHAFNLSDEEVKSNIGKNILGIGNINIIPERKNRKKK